MTTGGEGSFVIPPSVLHREVNGELVLLDVQSEQYFGLNAVGADIVKRLTEERYEVALAALAEDYEVDPATLQRDVQNLIDALVQAGLLNRVQEGD